MDVRKHTDAEIAEFLDRLIHDMREPLRSITVFSEVLHEIEGRQLGEEGDHALAQIPAGAARIRALLEGLSGYATALRETAETDSPVSMQSALTVVLGELDDRIRQCDATVTAANLPELGMSFDRQMQLLRILIDNSLRFRSGSAPVIRMAAAVEEPGMWTIRVEDNGIGIAPEDCESVFKPFMRAEGRKHGGVGLGLTIAKQIIEAHGGTIRIEPGAEQGAVCVFTLPEV